GIRDFHVTGVQTCALPILLYAEVLGISISILLAIISLIDFSLGSFEAQHIYTPIKKPIGLNQRVESFLDIFFFIFPTLTILYIRSEERRVGKDCRIRLAPH